MNRNYDILLTVKNLHIELVFQTEPGTDMGQQNLKQYFFQERGRMKHNGNLFFTI